MTSWFGYGNQDEQIPPEDRRRRRRRSDRSGSDTEEEKEVEESDEMATFKEQQVADLGKARGSYSALKGALTKSLNAMESLRGAAQINRTKTSLQALQDEKKKAEARYDNVVAALQTLSGIDYANVTTWENDFNDNVEEIYRKRMDDAIQVIEEVSKLFEAAGAAGGGRAADPVRRIDRAMEPNKLREDLSMLDFKEWRRKFIVHYERNAMQQEPARQQ